MSADKSRQETAAYWDQRWAAGERFWDHGRPSPVFEEFVQRQGPPAGEILVPGAGSGHDVRYFAGLGARVTGLDVSPTAAKIAQRENPHVNAAYMVGNFLQPETELCGKFDWVMEHTCLCSMHPGLWQDYADALVRYLKPGGYFLAIFYRNPASDEGPPFRIDAPAIDALFGSRFALLDSWVPERSYASRAGREELRWYQLKTVPELNT